MLNTSYGKSYVLCSRYKENEKSVLEIMLYNLRAKASHSNNNMLEKKV